MSSPNVSDSPLDAAVGAAGPDAVAAFKLLSNETRLAILLALWEAYDPADPHEAVPFSQLYRRVDADDTGNFNYHLNKLTEHFVEETSDGYRLRNAGQQIVQAVIAGAGLGETTVAPTTIPRTCHRCGATVELSYTDEHLYNTCPDCAGNLGPEAFDAATPGTIMVHDFNPAGLAHRTSDEVFVAGTIEFLRDTGLLIRGVCPQCSGAVEGSFEICEDHNVPATGVCDRCDTKDEVRARYRCTICKYGSSFPAEGVVHDHPAVVAFREEHGFEQTYGLEDPSECGGFWDHLMACDHDLLSEDPVQVEITVPGDGDHLELVLRGDLSVTSIETVPT